MRARIVLNRTSGTMAALGDRGSRGVIAGLADRGIRSQLTFVSGPEAGHAVRAALESRDVDIVIVGGGDGTVSAAASVMVGDPRPLAVLPLGTLNHLARDLGMPRRLEAAVDAIATGHVRAIDVGEVNDRVFVNNSSIGFYPELVLEREQERASRQLGKVTAYVRVLPRLLRRLSTFDVRVATPTRLLTTRSPMVLVGNNDYGLRFPWSTRRQRLDAGVLSVYVAEVAHRRELLHLLAHAAAGRLSGTDVLRAELSPMVVVVPRESRVRVAVDGEVFAMKAPLRYRIRPRALNVVVPPAEIERTRVTSPAVGAPVTE